METIILLLFLLSILVWISMMQHKKSNAATKTTEHFQAKQQMVQFWTKEQTYNFIIEDRDRFVDSMDETVYSQRTPINRADYIRNSASTATNFCDAEKKVLGTYAKKVDAHIIKLDPKMQGKLPPWKFALTDGSYYEMGEPHLRDGTIFLSSDKLPDLIADGCQLSLTLHYLRLEMLFPSSNKNKALYISHGAFPKNLSLPMCHSLV